MLCPVDVFFLLLLLFFWGFLVGLHVPLQARKAMQLKLKMAGKGAPKDVLRIREPGQPADPVVAVDLDLLDHLALLDGGVDEADVVWWCQTLL